MLLRGINQLGELESNAVSKFLGLPFGFKIRNQRQAITQYFPGKLETDQKWQSGPVDRRALTRNNLRDIERRIGGPGIIKGEGRFEEGGDGSLWRLQLNESGVAVTNF
jgi:hypothetical protein